jgi:thiol peroxidase
LGGALGCQIIIQLPAKEAKMATIKIGGNPVQTAGELPKPGDPAPKFMLTKTDLTDMSLKDFSGKKIVLNIFPSIDTSVCSASVRRFNQEISNFPGAVVICASLDLPFAHKRFCEAEGLNDVIPGSELRDRAFGDDYGVRIIEGPLKGLLARSVVVVDEKGVVLFSKLVEELSTEPDYEEVLDVLKKGSAESKNDSQACTSSATAEHSRLTDSDEPCDDGRAG